MYLFHSTKLFSKNIHSHYRNIQIDTIKNKIVDIGYSEIKNRKLTNNKNVWTR